MSRVMGNSRRGVHGRSGAHHRRRGANITVKRGSPPWVRSPPAVRTRRRPSFPRRYGIRTSPTFRHRHHIGLGRGRDHAPPVLRHPRHPRHHRRDHPHPHHRPPKPLLRHRPTTRRRRRTPKNQAVRTLTRVRTVSDVPRHHDEPGAGVEPATTARVCAPGPVPAGSTGQVQARLIACA